MRVFILFIITIITAYDAPYSSTYIRCSPLIGSITSLEDQLQERGGVVLRTYPIYRPRDHPRPVDTRIPVDTHVSTSTWSTSAVLAQGYPPYIQFQIASQIGSLVSCLIIHTPIDPHLGLVLTLLIVASFNRY